MSPNRLISTPSKFHTERQQIRNRKHHSEDNHLDRPTRQPLRFCQERALVTTVELNIDICARKQSRGVLKTAGCLVEAAGSLREASGVSASVNPAMVEKAERRRAKQMSKRIEIPNTKMFNQTVCAKTTQENIGLGEVRGDMWNWLGECTLLAALRATLVCHRPP